MSPGFFFDIKTSLADFADFEWHSAVMHAAKAAENGNKKAYMEIVRTVRSSRDVPGMENFQRAVMSRCHQISDVRERFECAKVCSEVGLVDNAYENLKILAKKDYWPAQYLLGTLILSDEDYSEFPENGHDLLRKSSGAGHKEGKFMSYNYRARDAKYPLRAWFLLCAFSMVPSVAMRADKFGEPAEASQISS